MVWSCKKCLIPLHFMNTTNSLELNCGLLSETSCSRGPYNENNLRSSVIVFSAVVVDIIITSSHFECAYTTTKYICPRNGPAKSNEFVPKVSLAKSKGVRLLMGCCSEFPDKLYICALLFQPLYQCWATTHAGELKTSF